MSKQENARFRNNDDIDETIREALNFIAGRLAADNKPIAAKAFAENAWRYKGDIRRFMQRRHTIRKKVTR